MKAFCKNQWAINQIYNRVVCFIICELYILLNYCYVTFIFNIVDPIKFINWLFYNLYISKLSNGLTLDNRCTDASFSELVVKHLPAHHCLNEQIQAEQLPWLLLAYTEVHTLFPALQVTLPVRNITKNCTRTQIKRKRDCPKDSRQII